jgi:hypothetical protein
MTTPQAVFNATTVQSGDLFSVYGTGYAGATNSIAAQTDFPISGYSTGTFAGVYGENTGTGQGMVGINTLTGTGVYGQNGSTGVGTYGQNTAGGIGVYGISTSGFGTNGSANAALATGVRGANANATGTGIIALGNAITPGSVLGSGTGLSANGTGAGIYSIATTLATGIGVMAGGNNFGTITTPAGTGAGVVGQGESFGIVGYASATLSPLTNNKWGGYFDYQSSANGFAFIGGRTGATDYGIQSAGAKLTMVKDNQNQWRGLACIEAPEILFQDYGTGQLVNGKAHISIDPLLAQNITIDEKHPLKVFVQLEGNCKGVYVANKTAEGFDVVELDGGTSSVSFSYSIVGNRADTKDATGNVTSVYTDWRFPVLPGRPQTVENVPVQLQTPAAPPAIPAKGSGTPR